VHQVAIPSAGSNVSAVPLNQSRFGRAFLRDGKGVENFSASRHDLSTALLGPGATA
jgi:hypothetical protein